MKDIFTKALSVFPEELKNPLAKAVSLAPRVYELRLVADKSCYLYTDNGIRFVTKTGKSIFAPSEEMLIPTRCQLEEITDRAMGFSGFLYENELKNGYITYAGGCRIGICTDGEATAFGKGKINSLAIRIPLYSETKPPEILDSLIAAMSQGLLIAGAPSSGKTTLLRYTAKKLSDGITGDYRKICVIDERKELSDGWDLGFCTDVICGKSKHSAILHAVRLLSPHFIVCDEIGTIEETRAILEGLNCGVVFVASMHAGSLRELIRRKQFRMLFDENVFGNIVFLSAKAPGVIEKIYSHEEVTDEIHRSYCTLPCT